MSGNPSIRNRMGKVEGKPGSATKVGSEWLGWRGTIAHPDSPAGGGGPGHFSRVRLAQREPGALPSPWRPGPLQPIPLQEHRLLDLPICRLLRIRVPWAC